MNISVVNAFGWRRPLFRAIPLLLLVLGMAGCGDVEWFPGYVRLPTTPDPFSFAAKTGTDKSTEVTSDSITVSGLTGSSSPVSVTGSTGSNSKYSVNGATATSAAGTVQNGDTVTVTHTSSAVLGTPTESTLFIGTESGKFVSTTRYFDKLTFSTPVQTLGVYMQAYATVTSVDTVDHVISIKDSLNSGNAQFSISDDLTPDSFDNVTRTISVLNGKYIFVRNLATTVATSGVTTTLTIDGIDTVVNLTPP